LVMLRTTRPDDSRTKTGKFLITLRLSRGYGFSRQEFLNMMGIQFSPKTWQRWELGDNIPRLYHLKHLLELEVIRPGSKEEEDLKEAILSDWKERATDLMAKKPETKTRTEHRKPDFHRRLLEAVKVIQELENCQGEGRCVFCPYVGLIKKTRV